MYGVTRPQHPVLTQEGNASKRMTKKVKGEACDCRGAPGVTRTHDTQIRNLVLYPPELRGHIGSFLA